jgi:hypothetical protein
MQKFKLNAGNPEKWATPAEIKAAAENGLDLFLNGIRCKLAANYNGYITAVTENGTIIQEWAGQFTAQEGARCKL